AAPSVNAGVDLSSCKNNPATALAGLVTGPTSTGVWSGGAGSYNPNSSTLNSIYTPNASELAAGSVTLTLTSSANGNCIAGTDVVVINFTDPPSVKAGIDLSVCKNNAAAVLSGLVSGTSTTGVWSGGLGTFNPNNGVLTATYTPSASEIATGIVTLTLTSTNNSNCNAVTDVVQINLTNEPVVNAGADIFACENNINSVLTGVVSGPTSTGVWSGGLGTFNPGNTALTTTYTPSQTEISAGFVILTLSSTNNGNCNAVNDFVQINFTSAPVVLAGNDISSCQNNPTSILSGIVTGPTTTGIWSGGAGTFNPSNTNLNSIYSPSPSELASGSATLILTSTNNGGCLQVTDTVVINYSNSPIANAGLDLNVCKNNANIALSGSVTGPTTSGIWTGGAGSFNPGSAVLNATYTPSPSELAAGFADLYLTSTNNGNCNQVIDTIKISFTDAPTVLAGPDISVCENTPTVTITGSVSLGSTTGIWSSAGSGSFTSNTSLNTTYQLSPSDVAIGTVVIKLTSTNNGNCNSEYDSLIVNVTPKPVVDAGLNDTICSNNVFQAINGSVSGGASTGIWSTMGNGSFGNITNLNTIYTLGQADTLAGEVKLVLTSTGGSCLPETDTVLIVLTKAPVVNSGSDKLVCDNQLVPLNGYVTGLTNTGIWTSLGTGAFTPNDSSLTAYYQPSALDISNGSVQILLTSTHNKDCSAVKDTVNISFKTSPIANFNTTNVCANNLSVFNDLSSSSSGSITSWYWDFGDNQNTTTTNANHLYSSAGTYTVSHVVNNTNGCTDTVRKTVDIYFLPQAQFYLNPACVGNSTQFTDSSKTLSGTIDNWLWNFGDGQTSTFQNPSHGFSSPVAYTVSLLVTSSYGCKDTIQKTVAVVPGPNADFSINPNPVEALEAANFTDLSTGPNSIVNWYWAFGDSTAANTQNTQHIYTDQGDYSVLLVVKDMNGCIDSARKDITIILLPDVPTAFSPNGDGQNDLFLVRGGPFKDINVRIYNNWGQLIFETNDQLEGWNGTFNGTEQPVGVFVWVVEVEMFNGKKIKKTGDVTLLR
ncbi:MAG TPA: PKD domain-containing protein, partial [Bacteroidia bacterium]|nr:PKD domain-containing protein [Bacteroidia bacterium]